MSRRTRAAAPTGSEPAQPVADSGLRRPLISLAWGTLQLVIVAALFLGGGIAVGYLAPSAVPFGLIAGAIAALMINHNARMWVQRQRLRGLRVKGVAVKAKVVNRDYRYTYTGRGGGVSRYTVLLRWTDPATGARWQGQRKYRFYGTGPERFDDAIHYGSGVVPVYYPPGRPSRFIIDIPFSPAMADVLP